MSCCTTIRALSISSRVAEVEAMEVDATVDNTWLWGQVLSVILAQCTNASGRTTLVYDAMGKRPGIASVACTCRAGREAARAAGPLWLATVDCRLAAPAIGKLSQR